MEKRKRQVEYKYCENPKCGKYFKGRVQSKYCSKKCFGEASTRDWKERFWEKVDNSGVCWIWQGSKDEKGYGMFYLNKNGLKYWRTNRVAYLIEHGDIPDGMEILHSCDNPSCVNPAHLRAGTHKENMEEREERKRVKKPRGGSGEKHSQSKLTNDDVLKIRELHATGEYQQKDIAAMFNVSRSVITNITKRKTWTHI